MTDEGVTALNLVLGGSLQIVSLQAGNPLTQPGPLGHPCHLVTHNSSLMESFRA